MFREERYEMSPRREVVLSSSQSLRKNTFTTHNNTKQFTQNLVSTAIVIYLLRMLLLNITYLQSKVFNYDKSLNFVKKWKQDWGCCSRERLELAAAFPQSSQDALQGEISKVQEKVTCMVFFVFAVARILQYSNVEVIENKVGLCAPPWQRKTLICCWSESLITLNPALLKVTIHNKWYLKRFWSAPKSLINTKISTTSCHQQLVTKLLVNESVMLQHSCHFIMTA